MNRTAICIKLLLRLYNGRVADRKELAEYLECNERNIREYINELRTAGYNIESQRGFNGGYKIDRNEFFPLKKLSENDYDILMQALDYMKQKTDFIKSKEFENIIYNILAAKGGDYEFDSIKIVEKYPLAMSNEEVKQRYNKIVKAIKNHKKISVKYQAVSSKNYKEYILHPYSCLIFNNYWYVIALNEAIKDKDPILVYKLNRFIDINELNESFTVSYDYQEEKYIGESSLLPKNKTRVKIMFKGVNIAISERIYGDNQEIIEIDENTIILDCYMNEFDALTLALGYGASAKILEPESLVTKYKTTLQDMLNQYNN